MGFFGQGYVSNHLRATAAAAARGLVTEGLVQVLIVVAFTAILTFVLGVGVLLGCALALLAVSPSRGE